MGNREELHELLTTITPNVYYQAPVNVNMRYPAIVYERRSIRKVSANNTVHRMDKSYLLTVMTDDPDSEIVDKIAQLQYCSHDNHFVRDGLYMDTFVIYY